MGYWGAVNPYILSSQGWKPTAPFKDFRFSCINIFGAVPKCSPVMLFLSVLLTKIKIQSHSIINKYLSHISEWGLQSATFIFILVLLLHRNWFRKFISKRVDANPSGLAQDPRSGRFIYFRYRNVCIFAISRKSLTLRLPLRGSFSFNLRLLRFSRNDTFPFLEVC